MRRRQAVRERGAAGAAGVAMAHLVKGLPYGEVNACDSWFLDRRRSNSTRVPSQSTCEVKCYKLIFAILVFNFYNFGFLFLQTKKRWFFF